MNESPKNGVWRWYTFFHSNLFAALVLWLLTAVGWGISFYVRTLQLESARSEILEWKGETKAVLKRMDEFGTINGHYADERHDKDIVDLQARMKKSEEEGRHWEVIETEHRRVIKDVEDLRNQKR